ncbi:hypothetical protein [Bacillus cereus]|uniref:hypothetical protein n=1 Tax=Bacillus cereus TaxID=1396 RepID=UPI00211629F3|nr:hypothetical protein [Bacillus cereus]
MKVFKNITSLLVVGAMGGDSLEMIPLHASAASIKNKELHVTSHNGWGSHSSEFGQT